MSPMLEYQYVEEIQVYPTNLNITAKDIYTYSNINFSNWNTYISTASDITAPITWQYKSDGGQYQNIPIHKKYLDNCRENKYFMTLYLQKNIFSI